MARSSRSCGQGQGYPGLFLAPLFFLFMAPSLGTCGWGVWRGKGGRGRESLLGTKLHKGKSVFKGKPRAVLPKEEGGLPPRIYPRERASERALAQGQGSCSLCLSICLSVSLCLSACRSGCRSVCLSVSASPSLSLSIPTSLLLPASSRSSHTRCQYTDLCTHLTTRAGGRHTR